MILNEKREINEILKELLSFDRSMELKYQKRRTSSSYLTVLAVFEKRMFRNGQIATASLLFIEGENTISLDVITAGGGKSAFDISDSINRSFYEKMIEFLERIGFVKEEGIDNYYF